MPKKFQGENSKSAQARARKADAKHAEKERLEREKEDALWRDDDKHVARKQHRKEEREKKKQEDLLRKTENRKLLEEEEGSLPQKVVKPGKVTRAQILANQMAAVKASSNKKAPQTHTEQPLEENPNIATAEARAAGVEEARSVEEAISVLSVSGTPAGDKHPEKRLKAAYAAFEEANMPRLKEENPTLRMSQLRQLLKKEWQKSPENPLNQR